MHCRFGHTAVLSAEFALRFSFVFMLQKKGPGLPRPRLEAVGPYCLNHGGTPRAAPSHVVAAPRVPCGVGCPRPDILSEAGVPGYKPCRRGGLARPSFSSRQPSLELTLPLEPPSVCARLGVGLAFQVQPGSRAKDWEDEQWRLLADSWVGLLMPFLASSPFFKDLGELALDSLWKVLRGKAAGTLRRHLSGFKRWMDFIYGREIVTADASVSVLVSFLACIQQRRSASNAPVTSLKFVAGILGWDKLLSCLANPVVAAWTGSYGQKEARKEALPLPLSAVANFERRVLESMGQEEGLDGDGLLTVAFLIMIWAALRFSDAQRVSVNEMDIVEGILRCCCWRTKSSRTPMAWGCLTVGVCGDWTPAVALLRQRLGDADFMIPGPSGDRASFTFALSQLRRLLVSVGKLPVEAVGVYTLHSLKVTGLSWGVQVDIDSVWQRLWGHHRSRDSGEAMAQKYGREDVLPALRGHRAVLESAGVDIGAAPSVLQCLEAGRLRRLLAVCKSLCAEPNAEIGTVAVNSEASNLLGVPLGPQLDGAKLKQLWKAFESSYPAEALESDGQPCKQLVQQIMLQKKNAELKFIPWKQILSVVQYDRARLSCAGSKEKSLLGLLADATGQVDPAEVEISASPFAVQKVLCLRSVAWALVDWCHLSSGKILANKFMMLYHRVGLSEMGLRPPTLAEAESADAELCRQLNDLLGQGHSLDKAIHEAVVVRDSLRI